FIIVAFLYVLAVSFGRSLFFIRKDRINILIYDRTPFILSLGQDDNVHYMTDYLADWKVEVPGGYGPYRVGAVRKLTDLEKKPDILTRTFSYSSSLFIDYIFYPRNVDIYFGKEGDRPHLPTVYDLFFTKTNASFFDTLYLSLTIASKRPQEITLLESNDAVKRIQGDEVFDPNVFAKKYQGFFYSKRIRDENKSVQILYTKSDLTAYQIARTIEGNGIRISDITQLEYSKKGCIVSEKDRAHSYTAVSLAEFFHCSMENSSTGIYDIIFTLGEKEKEWEVGR
ncbi:MAG: hypothetical protein Q7S61_01420, partial [bacterium]|nr:hypothetical protein [bacterium]